MRSAFLLLFIVAFGVPAYAYAYIGPGLGVVLVWSLLGPLAAVVATIALIAYFPIRYYYKKHKNKNKSDPDANNDSPSSGTVDTDSDQS